MWLLRLPEPLVGRGHSPPPTTSSIICRHHRLLPSFKLRAALSNQDSTTQFDLSLSLKRKAADISTDLKGTCLFLVGINSPIKSNSAQLLADALRYYYFDSDSVVEQALGGEDAVRSFMNTDLKGFRDSETEVLKQLSSMGRLVVSAGNGAVQCAANLALMRHGISIWIDVPLDMVAKQIVEENFQLPAAETISGSYSEVLAQLTAIYEDCRNGYATADATIALHKVASRLGYDTLDAVTTEDIALGTLKEVERLMRAKKLMEEAARPF
ncbi:putative inactive shikimate kinase like 1, chloroplastic [Capsicum annuum]|uniref:probable inactive shikimate kinase like 1, chloroplastic isoform X1 n=1 Tax=Capsicum annuum TaxID=4072 RepID=UPI001FB1A061|nr:probable inactive shikimate kinase like 1, chloroplastic isoform X1 [Capsicum annuum]KAF3617559.1 putative inactive shikimate kinase like 1, chloroplastic [Capsicum annuum]KAF3618767.1 putative inactive shikimate kinase like 1, chloroplastic [Capsicum annuum]